MEKEKLLKIKNEVKEHAQDVTTMFGLTSLLIYGANIDNVYGGVVPQVVIGTVFVGSSIVCGYKLSTEAVPNLIDNHISEMEESKVRTR